MLPAHADGCAGIGQLYHSEIESTRFCSWETSHWGFLFLSVAGSIWLGVPEWVLAHYLLLGGVVSLAVNALVLQEVRHRLSMMALLPLISVVMLWLVPAIQYWVEAYRGTFSNLPMQVDAVIYFRVAIPGVLAICWAYYLPLPVNVKRWEVRDWLHNTLAWCTLHRRRVMGGLLVAIVLGSVSSYLPEPLRFFGAFSRSFIYVLAIWWVMGPDIPYRLLGGALLWAGILLEALRSTMFGELVAVILILFTYCTFVKKYAWWKLWVVQLLLLVLLFWLISFKYRYREYSVGLTLSGQVELFTSLALDQIWNYNDPMAVDYGVARLGQGANMSLVLKHVPEKQGFVGGETIKAAIMGSLVPRFCWPDKPKAGGGENIRRFMGIDHLNYSINIGLVGESYVNYGTNACFVLFLMGYVLFFRFLYEGVLLLCRHFPFLILLLPMLFWPVTSIEKDVFTVLNQVIKTGFLVGVAVVFYYGIKRLRRRTF